MCKHLSLFFTASFIWMSQAVLGSPTNLDDANDAAPGAVTGASTNLGVIPCDSPLTVGAKSASSSIDPLREVYIEALAQQTGKDYFTLKELLKDTSLQSLNFYYKYLRLCPNLREANNLEELDLSNNQLTAAPVVSGLPKLKRLYLNGNKLPVAPDVTGLTKLVTLDLSCNQLTVAPMLTGLPKLKWLYLDSNLCGDPTLLETLRGSE